MAKTGKPNQPSRIADNKSAGDKTKKPPPPREIDDDDYEDGDIATPKRDRYGPDDEPF
ncbi:MAG: hypothetical protein HOQ25_20505 [Mesorhizobium sp.]|nr:hypothetical protein [Mesorhizobium sp.]